MRIPLIVYHDPRLSLKGPVVFLPEGKWIFRGNFKKRNLKVITGGTSEVELGEDTTVSGMQSIQIKFPEGCHESSVTIYAEKLD